MAAVLNWSRLPWGRKPVNPVTRVPPQLLPIRPRPQKPTTSTKRVIKYLLKHMEFLDKYLREIIPMEAKKRMLHKMKHGTDLPFKRKPKLPPITMGNINTTIEFRKRIEQCNSDEEMYFEMFTTSRCLQYTLNADVFNLYIVRKPENDLVIYDPTFELHEWQKAPISSVLSDVLERKKAVLVNNVSEDGRFQKGLGSGDSMIGSILASPIILKDQVYCVVEYCQYKESDCFTPEHLRDVVMIQQWMVKYAHMWEKHLVPEAEVRKLRLLESTQTMFEGDVDNIDQLVQNILIYTKNLVGAQRCSLFLTDGPGKNVVAKYFEDGSGNPVMTKGLPLQFHKHLGVVGYVARTGEVVNIPNAYRDARFDRTIDARTGFRTMSILCVPIFVKGDIIGIVEIINRTDGLPFTEDNEQMLILFADYCALALNFARVHEALQDEHRRCKAAMKSLQLHMNCPTDQYRALRANPLLRGKCVPEQFYTFEMLAYDHVEKLPRMIIRMATELMPGTFDINKLCHFVLTVRRNYRNVAYHNFIHAFHVTHCIWRLMMTCETCFQFTNLEKIALFVAGLCHDLDHRAYTNDFIRKTFHPMASLYGTSALEQHHYQMMVTIIQSHGNDIFHFMTSENYRQVLDKIKANILATDLGVFFPNKAFLDSAVQSGNFRIDVPRHRKSLMSLMMTAADLCIVSKPFGGSGSGGGSGGKTGADKKSPTIPKSVRAIYQEFYEQGDLERNLGITPESVMDRVHEDKIPEQQLTFISFICEPMYKLLVKLLPESSPLLEGLYMKRDVWMQMAKGQHPMAELHEAIAKI